MKRFFVSKSVLIPAMVAFCVSTCKTRQPASQAKDVIIRTGENKYAIFFKPGSENGSRVCKVDCDLNQFQTKSSGRCARESVCISVDKYELAWSKTNADKDGIGYDVLSNKEILGSPDFDTTLEKLSQESRKALQGTLDAFNDPENSPSKEPFDVKTEELIFQKNAQIMSGIDNDVTQILQQREAALQARLQEAERRKQEAKEAAERAEAEKRSAEIRRQIERERQAEERSRREERARQVALIEKQRREAKQLAEQLEQELRRQNAWLSALRSWNGQCVAGSNSTFESFQFFGANQLQEYGYYGSSRCPGTLPGCHCGVASQNSYTCSQNTDPSSKDQWPAVCSIGGYHHIFVNSKCINRSGIIYCQ